MESMKKTVIVWDPLNEEEEDVKEREYSGDEDKYTAVRLAEEAAEADADGQAEGHYMEGVTLKVKFLPSGKTYDVDVFSEAVLVFNGWVVK